ncbi:MAG: hypothetical protein DRQ45_01575 [Gammaproteobacteria bacterium]|nr:MAG: hypothetical protein DRQ45_01575 [Gammaproteobacteria bacterium]
MKFTTSRFIGLFLAAIHLMLFTLFSIKMYYGSQDAMSGMLWGLWEAVDFPVSLLAHYGFISVPIQWSFLTFVRFIYPYFVYGVLGTIWWFLIPVMIGGLFNKLLKKNGSPYA